MSERETPLSPNPSSGGASLEPSPTIDPANLPPMPATPIPPRKSSSDEDAGVNEANEKLANASLLEDLPLTPIPPPDFNLLPGDDSLKKQETSVKQPVAAFSFNFDKADDSEDDAIVVEDVSDDDEDEDDVDDEEEEGVPQDIMSMFPPKVVRRVNKLKELHSQREEIMNEYLVERAALEKKFAVLCKPLFEQRLDVIEGKLDEEIEKNAETDAEQEEEEEEDEDEVKGIPQFWVCAMGHMEAVAELITQSDVDCLEHLRNVTCDDDDDGCGFTISFHFGPNPYFTNTVLTKKYQIPNLLLEDEPILKNVEGCTIDWKAGTSLTYREVTKKQRSKSGRKAGQIRTITKRERTDSFFHFFTPPKMPSMETMDEEEADAIEDAFDHDYDVAQAFRSHIIPKAVLWFTGEVRCC
uniref:Nucleosome assembly protein n=1 Tax=Ditylum brightwellii TaxID=49249 RepID=A0A7S4W3L7_9STRA|mmetsp:Transcript_55776/g.83078  ORF Transcript_55776/g.83078 Transcript_55776/m.83078 type:complete len:411 (+) Transcript_55776:109-1341(+)